MGRPVHADGQRTRHAILDAALDLFAGKGYFGTSLRDIAGAVGVRESALYHYFASKEALFEALILADRQSKVERLEEIADEPITDARAMLGRLALLTVEGYSQPRQQQLFRILMSDGFRLAKEGRINLFERMSNGQSQLHELMARLIRARCLRQADPQHLAMEFMGPLLLWRHMHAIGSGLPALANLQAFALDHVDQFLLGAAPRPRGVASREAGRTHARPAGPKSKNRSFPQKPEASDGH